MFNPCFSQRDRNKNKTFDLDINIINYKIIIDPDKPLFKHPLTQMSKLWYDEAK